MSHDGRTVFLAHFQRPGLFSRATPDTRIARFLSEHFTRVTKFPRDVSSQNFSTNQRGLRFGCFDAIAIREGYRTGATSRRAGNAILPLLLPSKMNEDDF